MPLPTADEISNEVPKERPLPIRPWMAAYLSDVWQGMRKNLEESMKKKDKQDHEHTSPSKPASARNQT